MSILYRDIKTLRFSSCLRTTLADTEQALACNNLNNPLVHFLFYLLASKSNPKIILKLTLNLILNLLLNLMLNL